DMPAEEHSPRWLVFLRDGQTLAVEDKEARITVWDLSGPLPRSVVSRKRLEELTPAERDLLAAGVRRHPPGADLPESWRTAFLPWTHRLHARVTEAGVVVMREDRDGKEAKLLEWSPPGDVRRVQFSGDGKHLVVTNDNGTVEVIRLGSSSADGRLLAS